MGVGSLLTEGEVESLKEKKKKHERSESQIPFSWLSALLSLGLLCISEQM